MATTSTNEGAMPPLMVVDQTSAANMKALAPNTVQTFMLKQVSPNKSKVVQLASPPKVNNSNMMTNVRIVQTADGKKLILTNVVGTSQVSSNGSFVIMPKRGLNTPITAGGQFVSSPNTAGQFVSSPNTAGQFISSPTTAGQFISSPTTAGQFVSSPTTAGQFVSSPNTAGQFVSSPTTAGQFVTSPTRSINAPQTIFLNPGLRGMTSLSTTGTGTQSLYTPGTIPVVPPFNQPVVLNIPGLNQPVVIKPFTPNPDDVNKLSPRITQQQLNPVETHAPAVNTAADNRVPFAALQSDANNPVMYLKSGNSTYKVVGKPVPVQLHPNLPHIAPKVIMNEVAGTGNLIQKIPLPPLRSAKKPQNIEILSPVKSAPSAVPPAYLNLCVNDLLTEAPNTPTNTKTKAKPKSRKKRKASVGPSAIELPSIPFEPSTVEVPSISFEPSTIEVPSISAEPMVLGLGEEETPQIKEEELTDEPLEDPPEGPLEEPQTPGGGLPVPDHVEEIDSMLDVKIKEEPKDDLTGELLARDEQLREVLGIPSKFYIRTSEGKLVTITHEEAKALGLDHQDKVENNQKKLMNALSFIKDSPLYKGISGSQFDDGVPCPETGDVKIPEDVDIQDYVSRHVDPAAEKNASLMKALGQKRLEMFNKDLVPAQTNTAIIGEFSENDRHYLRLEIEMEPKKRHTVDIIISPLNLYQCPFCIKEFKTKDHIISHLRIHTGERPYPCEVCGKRYRQRIDIIRHMRIHTGEKPFSCGLCDASFNQKSNLRSHMRIHTGERPVQCNVCGKGFSRNTHLKQHMKLHTGEKPYQCKVCYRPFRFKSGLQAHERIHSGMKPYACSLCGRSFTQIVGLLRHERTHVGEKPFRCQSCGKSFNSRENLKAHVMKHTSARPFACDICDKTFTDRTALRCHRKKYHSENLICVLCLSEDFKDRIELREHLRQHERANWKETSDGVLVPIVRNMDTGNLISVDDTGTSDDDGGFSINGAPENIQVDVDVEPVVSIETGILHDDDGDSEYEEHELYIPANDPLA